MFKNWLFKWKCWNDLVTKIVKVNQNRFQIFFGTCHYENYHLWESKTILPYLRFQQRSFHTYYLMQLNSIGFTAYICCGQFNWEDNDSVFFFVPPRFTVGTWTFKIDSSHKFGKQTTNQWRPYIWTILKLFISLLKNRVKNF